MFVFDVWCERKKLLGDLDMAEAIASFLHLSFVCNLKYPKVRNSQFLVRPFFFGSKWSVCAALGGFRQNMVATINGVFSLLCPRVTFHSEWCVLKFWNVLMFCLFTQIFQSPTSLMEKRRGMFLHLRRIKRENMMLMNNVVKLNLGVIRAF